MPKCKDCGREATEEQVFDAASKVQDLNAMMQGLTSWQCTLCRTREVAALQMKTPIQLAPTEALIGELLKRFPHVIVAYRTIPVKGVNDAMEGQYLNGDYRMCQGLATGIISKVERDILASVDRRRSMEEHEEADDV